MESFLLIFLAIFAVLSWIATVSKNAAEEQRQHKIAEATKAFNEANDEAMRSLLKLQDAFKNLGKRGKEINAKYEVIDPPKASLDGKTAGPVDEAGPAARRE